MRVFALELTFEANAPTTLPCALALARVLDALHTESSCVVKFSPNMKPPFDVVDELDVELDVVLDVEALDEVALDVSTAPKEEHKPALASATSLPYSTFSAPLSVIPHSAVE